MCIRDRHKRVQQPTDKRRSGEAFHYFLHSVPGLQRQQGRYTPVSPHTFATGTPKPTTIIISYFILSRSIFLYLTQLCTLRCGEQPDSSECIVSLVCILLYVTLQWEENIEKKFLFEIVTKTLDINRAFNVEGKINLKRFASGRVTLADNVTGL